MRMMRMEVSDDKPPGFSFGDFGDIDAGFVRNASSSCDDVDRDIILLFVLCDHDKPSFCRFLVDSQNPVQYRSYEDSCFDIGCSLIHSVATDQEGTLAFLLTQPIF